MQAIDNARLGTGREVRDLAARSKKSSSPGPGPHERLLCFYGTTYVGGRDAAGTVFSLSTGLGPFVRPLPHSGTIGATVKILGTNLTGATSVSFNGTSAAFTVVSATEISTTVPNRCD